MRHLLIISVFFLCSTSLSQAQEVFPAFESFFAQHIKQGLVDYSSVKNQRKATNELKELISSTDWKAMSPDGQKAFLINSYNFFTIEKLARYFPVSSPKSIGNFFHKKEFFLKNKKYSLDQIEKDLLFGLERDPRFHLVLICGAMGCPPFPSEVFTPDNFEQQLEQASQMAMNHPDWIKEMDNNICISKIFNWYGFDFGDLRKFFKKYRPDLDESKPLKIIDYNWAINDVNANGDIPRDFMTPSQLLNKGTWELKSFQSAYTQASKDGFEQFNSRQTYFSSFNQFLIGTSPNVNVGLDVVWKKNFLNDLAGNSFLNFIDAQTGESYLTLNEGLDSLNNSDGENLKTTVTSGLAHLGPKIKFKPLKNISKLTLQQTVYLPIERSVDGQLISFTQFFYDQNLGARSSVFLELSFWTPLRPNVSVFPFLKSFWSYFPNKYISAYAMLALPGEYGAGFKINVTRKLELEFLHTRYVPYERFFEGRQAESWNIGIRLHP